MKRQDRSHFDNAWENAFDEAEMAPTDQVWDKIELGLAKQANSGYKKRILFFKLLAAASVLFAAVVGGVAIYEGNFDGNGSLATQAPYINKPPQQESAEELPSSTSKQQRTTDKPLADLKGLDGGTLKTENNNALRSDKSSGGSLDNGALPQADVADRGNTLIAESNDIAVTTKLDDKAKESQATPLLAAKSNTNIAVLATDSVERLGLPVYGIGALLEGDMHLVPRYAEAYQMKKKTRLAWVGVDLAMGQNSPSSSSGGGADLAMAEFQATNNTLGNQMNVSDEQAGNVLVAGIAVGKHLSERWIVESGMSYIKRSTFAESNLSVAGSGRPEALNSLSNATTQDRIVVTDSYELKNTYNSIAVPIQAGYLLLNRRFDIALKAGVANEILLWNRVEDTSGNLESVNINPGENSQYNTYLISGLVGSEFSYLVSDHYYISVAPQLRKSINSITKSDDNDENRPLVFTLGFKVNYLFK